MGKALHYSLTALALVAIGWVGYQWQRGADPLGRAAVAQTDSKKGSPTEKQGKPTPSKNR